MTCHAARELFSARLDGMLLADEAAGLETHLAGCADCRAEWARFERTVSLVRGLEPAHAPVGFVDRVLEAARPEPCPLRVLRQVFLPLRLKLPLEAAAVFLVGGLAVMIFQQSPEMQRAARQELDARVTPSQPPAAPVPQSTSEPPAVASKEERESPPVPSLEKKRSKSADIALADRMSPAEQKLGTKPDVAPAPPTPAPQTVAPAPQTIAPAPQNVAPAPSQAPAPPASAAAPAPREAPSSPQGTSAVAPTAPPASGLIRPRVAQEPSRVEESARRDVAAKSATAPLAAAARRPPDITARLSVADRAAALNALANIVTRLGGREIARQTDRGSQIVDVVLPRESYDAFTRQASQLGNFTAEHGVSELPPAVTVSIRVTD